MSPPGNPRLITDPRAAPVVSIDGHLPAVAPERLTPDALRRRFSEDIGPPEFAGDSQRLLEQTRTPAAVLVGLVTHAEGMRVLLTQRTAHLRAHAGQISFPGGRAEASDADAAETACREAFEEVGLPSAAVEVIGALPVYSTVTDFIVTPIVALIAPGRPLVLDPHEVADAFEVPLAFLMNPAHHRWHEALILGHHRRYLSMPWRRDDAAGHGREAFVWGATAAMLRNLYRVLAA